MRTWPAKDPDDILDYAIDWAGVLAEDADTIATATWSVPDGLTLTDETIAAGVTTAWISGGEAGAMYEISCRMVTAGGRTYDRTVTLSVREA